MNKVQLIGRITKDIEVRKTESGKSTARFSLAVNRMGADGADFISCVAWEKSAEILEKYTSKGSQVAIEGHITTGSYDNKQTGQKVYTTDVVVERVELLGSKQTEEVEIKSVNELPKANHDLGIDINSDLPF